MESIFKSAEVTSNPVTSPEKLAGKISNNQDFLLIASLFGLAFFCLYAYKTYLEVKVAKQELAINIQELELNKALLLESNV